MMRSKVTLLQTICQVLVLCPSLIHTSTTQFVSTTDVMTSNLPQASSATNIEITTSPLEESPSVSPSVFLSSSYSMIDSSTMPALVTTYRNSNAMETVSDTHTVESTSYYSDISPTVNIVKSSTEETTFSPDMLFSSYITTDDDSQMQTSMLSTVSSQISSDMAPSDLSSQSFFESSDSIQVSTDASIEVSVFSSMFPEVTDSSSPSLVNDMSLMTTVDLLSSDSATYVQSSFSSLTSSQSEMTSSEETETSRPSSNLISSNSIYSSDSMSSLITDESFTLSLQESDTIEVTQVTSVLLSDMISSELTSLLMSSSFISDDTPPSSLISEDDTTVPDTVAFTSDMVTSSSIDLDSSEIPMTSSMTTMTSSMTTTTSSMTTTTPTTTPVYSYPTETPNLDNVIYRIPFEMTIQRNSSDLEDDAIKQSLENNITQVLSMYVFTNITDVFQVEFREGSIIAEIEAVLTATFLTQTNTSIQQTMSQVTVNFEAYQNIIEETVSDLDFNESLDSLRSTEEQLRINPCSAVSTTGACSQWFVYRCTNDVSGVCVHKCDVTDSSCGENGVCYFDIITNSTACRCTTSSYRVYHGPNCDESTATLSFFLALSLGIGLGSIFILCLVIVSLCSRNSKGGKTTGCCGERGSMDGHRLTRDQRLSVRSNEAYYDGMYIPTLTGDEMFDSNLSSFQSRSYKKKSYSNQAYQDVTAL